MNNQKLNEVLLSVFETQSRVDAWWKVPNPHMNYQIPQKLMETAPEKVSEFVMQYVLLG